MNTSRDILIALVIKYKGKWDDIMTAVSLREHPEDEFLQKVELLKCRTVTLIDPEYPAALRHIVNCLHCIKINREEGLCLVKYFLFD